MSSKNFDIFKFIAAVRNERYLYDKNHIEYRNADKRQNSWNKIAEQFGFVDGKNAYKKWKYLKDHFFAEKKKMNQKGIIENNNLKKWQYYDALKWTEQFLDKRKCRSPTDEQLDENLLESPSPSTVINDLNKNPIENMINDSRQQIENTLDNAFSKIHDEKESEMEAFLFRPFESNYSSVGITVNSAQSLTNTTSLKQQQQLLHQALVAESEEELFGRLVARDLVRLPPNLRPLARLKIQELLYHFSIGHVPEMH